MSAEPRPAAGAGAHPAHAIRIAGRRAGRGISLFWRKAYQEDLTGLAAMVAYNLLLSILPLALLALFVAGRLLGSAELEKTIFEDLQELFPDAADSTINSLLNRVENNSTTVGILALISSIWIGGSFWGAVDTAFCRIYHMRCRSWVEQKRFALIMLVVSLLLVAATVGIPAAQSLLVSGAEDLPFGLDEVQGLVAAVTLLAGLILLFGLLCLIYWAVPNRLVPWFAVWPGALGATLAIAIVDYAFPFYLGSVTSLDSFGTTFVFVVIVLVWFYVIAIIILGGAVINALRFEKRETGELAIDG